MARSRLSTRVKSGPATVSASNTVGHSGTGVAQSQSAQAAGVGNVIRRAVGDAIAQASTVSGTGAGPAVPVTPILDSMTEGAHQQMPSAGGNTSDIMYNPVTNRYHTVMNNTGGDQDVYTESGGVWTHQADVNLSLSPNDTEGICWIGGASDYYSICEEVNNSFRVITSANSVEQTHTLPPRSASNQGLEGIYYASEARLAQGNQPPGAHGNGAMFGVNEGRSGDIRIYRAEMPPFDGNDYHYDFPTSGDAALQYTEFDDPSGATFDTYARALSNPMLDGAALVFDPRNGDGRIVVLSEASRALFEFTIGGTSNDRLTHVADLDLDSSPQWEGMEIMPDGNYVVNSEPNTGTVRAAVLAYSGAGVLESAPSLAQSSHVTAQPIASTLTKSTSLATGGQAMFYKEYGPPSMTVDPKTGEISWLPSDDLPRGQGVMVRIGAANSFGHADPMTFHIHVNNTGQSNSLKVTGDSGISSSMGPAMEDINAGDTLLVSGSTTRNVHESTSGDYLNAIVRTSTTGDFYTPPNGSSAQLTTVAAEDPAMTISGAPHGSITAHANYGLDLESSQTEYLKVMGFTWKEIGRQAGVVTQSNIFLEMIGLGDAGYERWDDLGGRPPQNFAEADPGDSSIATALISGSNNLQDYCHSWGQGRYLNQSRGTDCIRRCVVVRPDEYHGDQPRGAITGYGTVRQTDFNCFAVDGDQEDTLVPHYKNVAGMYAQPATGVETVPVDNIVDRSGGINTKMSPFGVMDATNTNIFNSYGCFFLDSMQSEAPQTGNKASPLLQSSSQYCDIDRVGTYRTQPWNLESFGGMLAGNGEVNWTNCVSQEDGWSGSASVNYGDFASGGSNNSLTGTIHDFKGSTTASNWSVTVSSVNDAHLEGWEHPFRVEAGSNLDIRGEGPDAVFLKGKPFHRRGDTDWNTDTSIPAWPRPGQDIMRADMRDYSKTGLTVRGGATDGTITGERGFCVDNENFSEYVAGYFGYMVMPLRIDAKVSGADVTFYNAPLESFREDSRTGWNVYKTTDLSTPVASVDSKSNSVTVSGLTSGTYVMTNKFSTYTASAFMNGGESGPSIEQLAVTI